MSSLRSTPRQLWQQNNTRATKVDAFRRHVNQKFSLNLSNYQELWEWSVADVGLFTAELLHFCDFKYSVASSAAVSNTETMWPRPVWFPGARMNYTENILAHAPRRANQIAISACREGGTDWRQVTWTQLYSQVAAWATALRAAGVTVGDRVAVVMTNCIESVVILLACGAIGAIYSSSAPDLGATAIVERYQQVKPKIVFLDSEVLYNTKRINLSMKMRTVGAELKQNSGLQRIVVCQGTKFHIPGLPVVSAVEFLAVPEHTEQLAFEQLPFDHPIYILYSSGTTGPPKCICHSAGGQLLQQKKEFLMSYSLGVNDCHYQYTTVGWMMFNYACAALSCGARLVLYDGSPMVPNCSTQLRLLESQGVTLWGTSPKFLGALRSELSDGIPDSIRLKSLTYVSSAGSPLTSEMYKWFYKVFPKNIGLFSGSGGTDLGGGIVMGSPLLPVYAGEIQASALGMKVEVWNNEGENIEHTGEPGDLVITKPFLGMPITFWGPDGERKYHAAYFERFPGVWSHGDFIKKLPTTGGYEILGRSDGVLNPGGVRFGSAELYNVMERFGAEVMDCLVVSRRRDRDVDEAVMMFLKLKPGASLSDSLIKDITVAIRTSLSGRHVPSFILEVKDIPYTANGKKVESLIKAIVSGRTMAAPATVINPECLHQYRKFVDIEAHQTRKVGTRLPTKL